MTTPGTKVKALCVATRCASVDQFVATFSKFCDDDTFFVSTLTTRPVGLETAFSIQLSDGAPVLRGLCVVREMYSTPANPYGRPGIRLGIVRLTRESTDVFRRLRARRATTAPVAPEPELVDDAPATAVKPPRPPLATTMQPFVATVAPAASVAASPAVGEAAFVRTPPPIPPPRSTAPSPPATKLEPAAIAASPAEIEAPVVVPTVVRARPAPVEIEPPEPAASPIEAPPIAASPRAAVVIGAIDDVTAPVRAMTETRTPGSELVLPANPLMNLTDESLEGFVDCTLYEATGQFPIDETTPLPGSQLRSVVMPPIEPPLASPSMVTAAIGSPEIATPPPAPEPVPDPEPAVIAAPVPPRVTLPPPTLEALVAEPVVTYEPPLPSDMPPMPDESAHVTFYPPHDPGPLTPLPYGQATPIAVPRRRAPIPRRAIVIAASTLAFAALIALVVRVRGSREDTAVAHEPVKPAATLPARPRVAAPAPPVVEAAAPQAEPEPATVGGLPVVGKGPCRVTVVATPAGAAVQLDGEAVGPAPLTIDGPCQRRRVDLAHARYAPATRWITPTAGKAETLDVTLARPTHSVTVVTQPAGATVLIDGRRAGTSPTVVRIMGFQSMSLTVEKPGFQPVTQRVYSKVASDRVVITLPLKLFSTKRK